MTPSCSRRWSSGRRRDIKPDVFGRWIGPDGDVALPLYQGWMIGQFDSVTEGWVSGQGRTAVWREIPFDRQSDRATVPDGSQRCFDQRMAVHTSTTIALSRHCTNTNERTIMIACRHPGLPCGTHASTLTSES